MKKSLFKLVLVEPLGKGGWAQYSYCLLSNLAPYLDSAVLFTASSTPFKNKELPFKLKPVLFSVSNFFIDIFKLQHLRRLRRLLKALEIPLNHLKLLLYCWRERPDILHFQAAYWIESLFIPLYHFIWIKILDTAHDHLHHPPYPGDLYLFRYLYRKLDAIIVTAESLKKRMIKQFPGVAIDKVYVIRIGNIDALEGNAGISSTLARRSLSLPESTPVILFFGIIRAYKGLEVLIQAFALLIEKLPFACLIIAGEPIESFRRYQKEINRLNLSDRVKLVLNYIPQSEISAYFSAADLVAVPYHDSYTSAIVPLAYSYDRPVVVSRVGGLAEYVQEGESGYSFADGDFRDLSEKMYLILSDKKKTDRIKEFVNRYYRKNFSWQKIALATLAVYQKEVIHDRK